MEKTCTICLETKPISEFSIATKYKTAKGEHRTYYHSWCKPCDYKKHYQYTLKKTKGLITTYAYRKESIKKYRAKNKLQIAAREAIRWRLISGSIVKGVCFCGETKVEAHHYKGYEPENKTAIQWLCKKHHKEADKLMRQKI